MHEITASNLSVFRPGRSPPKSQFCRSIGRPIDLQNCDFGGLLPGLKTDKFDAVISCITVTEERKKEADFSESYYDAGQIVAVRAEETSIKSKDDLKGKVIAAQSNTTGYEQ